MNPYMAYDALNTKIISKKGHLLEKDDWNKIVEFTNVDQFSNYLKNKPIIKRIITDNKNDIIHRDSLEMILGRYKGIEIENLLYYFSGPYKEFIKTMLIESEIQDLSLILRKISKKEDMYGIKERFIHSEKHTNLSYDKLINSKNISEFTENLKNTPYYLELRNVTEKDVVNREFHIEMKLHSVLYKTFIKRAGNLKQEDMKIAKEIIGYKIDLENIQWMYRALKYYDISSEEMLIYSLSGGNKLSYNRLKILSYTKSVEEFKKLSNAYLKFDFFKEEDNINIDIEIDSYMFNFLKKSEFTNIGTALSYIFVLDIVIKDLTSVIEGIKYKVSKDKLKGYLAHKI